MSEDRPKGPLPRLGTPQIKSGPRRTAEQPAEGPLPTRRSLRQHRRADSAAGAPAGHLSRATILELPATIISPSDVGPLTGQLPTDIYSTRGEIGRRYDLKSQDPAAPAVRVDHDGVPVGPDGHPLTRRELRERRRRQEEAAAVRPAPSTAPSTAPTTGPAAAGPQHQPRRAEAPAGSPRIVAEPVTRASLAAEGAALAARIEESGGGDPSAVDPVLLREQELLAERARQLNTGLITRVPVADPAPAGSEDAEPDAAASGPAGPSVTAPPSPAAAQEPVQARSAHGLDSLGASAWSSRERNLILAAGLVILLLLLALILALVL